MDSHTLPTHSVLFLFLLIQNIFAMGRCCNLSTQPGSLSHCTHRHCTAVHLLYLIPYASIYIQYILLPPSTCFSVPTPLTPVIVTLSAQCISTKLVLSVSCIYHWMCIYIMYIYQMQAMYNTCCFPSPSATPASPLPTLLSPPRRAEADGFPLMCRGSACISA